MLHIERSNYQAYIWNKCLLPKMRLQPPCGNGWLIEDDQLKVLWMTRPSAPDTLIEVVTCHCKTGCKTLRCSCLKSGFKCTDLCGCADCCNFVAGDDDLSEDENDDDDCDDKDDEYDSEED